MADDEDVIYVECVVAGQEGLCKSQQNDHLDEPAAWAVFRQEVSM